MNGLSGVVQDRPCVISYHSYVIKVNVSGKLDLVPPVEDVLHDILEVTWGLLHPEGHAQPAKFTLMRDERSGDRRRVVQDYVVESCLQVDN